MSRSHPLSVLLAVILAGLALSACTPAEQEAMQTQVARELGTAAAAARTQVGPSGGTAAADAQTRTAAAAATAMAEAQARAGAAASTALAEGKTRAVAAAGTAVVEAQTRVVAAAGTAVVEAQTRAVTTGGTAVVAGQTAAVAAAGTALIDAQTRAVPAAQTALAGAERVAQTQVAVMRATLLPAPQPTVLPLGTPAAGAFQTILTAPFERCTVRSNHSTSPAAGSRDILSAGFSSAHSSCDAEQGSFNTGLLVFGGKNGNVFKAADQQAEASAEMNLRFTPPFSGTLRIEASLVISAGVGAAAGPATARPEQSGVVRAFLVGDDLVKAFADTAGGLVLPTFAGANAEAYVAATVNDARQEQRAPAGDQRVSASFPVPPQQQQQMLDRQPVTVTLLVPVQEGRPLDIAAGLVASARANGWAMTYWNPAAGQQARVVRILLAQQP